MSFAMKVKDLKSSSVLSMYENSYIEIQKRGGYRTHEGKDK